MKEWKPERLPSNRDRLELYSLHKQAVSGDAPDCIPSLPSNANLVAEKAKFNAWKSKRGVGQNEAMMRYIDECERQQRVYGGSNDNLEDKMESETRANAGTGGSIPRGLAAIPLLSAAATEGLERYKYRIARVSVGNQAWWGKQEPLCAEPGTPLALPEHIVLEVARKIEEWACALNGNKNFVASSYPAHNVLIAIWVMCICLCTFVGSVVILGKTIILGKKRVGFGSIEDQFRETIVPLGATASTLMKNSNNALSIRIVGLILTPLTWTCQTSKNLADNTIIIGASFYLWIATMTWIYWLSFIPWSAVGLFWASVCMGGCYGLIEFAEIEN